jgi:hypothetical protein
MKKRLRLWWAPIVMPLLLAAPVSAKIDGLAGKWSGHWTPNGGSRETVAIEFRDGSGEKGRFTAPEEADFTDAKLDPDSGMVTLEAANSKSGKKYRIEGMIEGAELNGLMTVGDATGEVYLSNSLLKRIDHAEFPTYLRESEYGFVFFLTLHILSMSCLVGANSIVSMRLLGVASSIPLQPLRRLFPVMWAGFIGADLSGVCIGLAHASTRLWNPIFAVKLAIIFIAAPVMWKMQKTIFDDPRFSEGGLPPNARKLAAAQLILWLSVLVAGRLIAYSFTIFGEGY